MKIITNIPSLRRQIATQRKEKKRIGFVPTMGTFHNGHLSLMRHSRRENDITVVSIFVNPTQFGPNEDFKAYPRQKKKDILLAKKENIDIIFYPSVKEIYPDGYLTFVEVNTLPNVLCGRTRPGHFKGVTTVVSKLLNIVTPDTMYLGQKDAQQAIIIQKMIADLNWPVKIAVKPIVREKDGLAMSSRNAYLSSKQRKEAAALYKALKKARQIIKAGEKRGSVVRGNVRQYILRNSSGKIDYIECVTADSLKPLKKLKGRVLIALAVKFARVRLIDNIIVSVQ